MWDFFKGLLGLPRLGDNSQRPNTYEDNDSTSDKWTPGSFSEEESADVGLFTHTHPFSVFTNPLEMHSYFEKQMDEFMRRAFDFSGMGFPKIILDGDDVSVDRPGSSENLRDEFLKPEFNDDVRQDSDLDGRVGTSDIQRFLDAPSAMRQTPKIISKSVIIRSVRRPDGIVETVRTERDHTGREETTVTQQGPDHPNIEPSGGPNAPLSGSDIFSKIFL